MKKAALVLALALLTGCSSSEALLSTPDPIPSSSPTPSPTPCPTPSLPDPGSPDCPPLWISLPGEGLPIEEEHPCVEEGDVLWRVFYHVPELEATLYDVTYTDKVLERLYAEPAFGDREAYGAQFVLQSGDHFGEVFRSGYWSDQLGHLSGGDYDGDGEMEYVVSRWRDLILCNPNEDGGWDSYSYSDKDFGRDALPLLTVEQDDCSVTVRCGESSVSYRMEDGLPGKTTLSPLDFPQMLLWFEDSDNSLSANATLTVSIEGQQLQVIGHLRGELIFDGEGITLRSLCIDEPDGA